jgi:uridine kinase
MDTVQARFIGEAGTKVIVCQVGTRVAALLPEAGWDSSALAAVLVNNEALPLSARLDVDSDVEPVPLAGARGASIYRASLSFVLTLAAKRAFPDRPIAVGHSLGHSFYYHFADERKPTDEDVSLLEKKMRALVEASLPITLEYMAYAQALAVFHESSDTATLLEQRCEPKLPVNACDGFIDLYFTPLVHNTSLLRVFALKPYEDGFLLAFPSSKAPDELPPLEEMPRIFAVYYEYKKWGRIVGVHTAGKLNALVRARKVKDFIDIAEAFHQKKLAEIADAIYQRRERVKMVMIAGPSSSGKTTTAKRLSIQLKVLGIEPVAVSLDNYYREADGIPLDEDGKPDLECLEALDLPFLNEQLAALLGGASVTLPVYDFKTQRRREGAAVRLGRRTMLVIEGIHGLNDRLTTGIDAGVKFKLYVSALTQLNLDSHNRVPTTDNRILRRLVRDYQFRGTAAARTFAMWPSVRRGEERHIFPHQNNADAAFNSALDYEIPVLKFYAEPILRAIPPTTSEFTEAARLLSFLKNFAPIPPQHVPGQSILREFIGESDFKY